MKPQKKDMAKNPPWFGFHISQRAAAAQNYAMPALSPTMTEGNIASWRLKEGDSFAAGDVILEIETDKATMDVEAQDDGILMKITKPDGTKGVKVGERIAVLAEEGDDISSLELPKEDSAPQRKQAEQPKQEAKKENKPAPKQEEPPSQTAEKGAQKVGQEGKQLGAPRSRKYPLYPSVEAMLHQNGISEKDADSIPASGPQGRLLKGDVLAYLGKIKKDYPAESSKRLEKLSHLDLSNIQLAKKAEGKPEQPKAAGKAAAPEPPKETEIGLRISLSQVIATQKRVQDTLGIRLPLSTLIARASEMANEDLPLSKNRKPTADELFNSILGLEQVKPSSKGAYFPLITGLMPAPMSATKPASKADIIDILAAPKAKKPAPRSAVIPAGISTDDNIFSVMAQPGDESRATEYLERVKLVLEKEPGRLVL
ncbi:uncharacterized protein MYCFIDRAFT_184606 [Pseudocercospora fijiensis CIRAD86]|uniref:Pyruvate dehydrogenase protein x component n=1 Tax=Pseudocercospora fijiensis (strain CIRAD86) TaxID=383855 RepID=N1Q7M7_PSEFD|nr:uncharacterized protein MYCFIDRAFT_184606 [Pseudocercospora fijiensis CIRAD86]EME87651.1 hypothetical protein MYCFIDRAFT_184606 [Pseudocercospora fijiensis CIRAD86]